MTIVCISRQCKIVAIREYVSFNFYLYIKLKCIALTLSLIRELHLSKVLNNNNSSDSDSSGATLAIFAHSPIVRSQAQVHESSSNNSVSLPPMRPIQQSIRQARSSRASWAAALSLMAPTLALGGAVASSLSAPTSGGAAGAEASSSLAPMLGGTAASSLLAPTLGGAAASSLALSSGTCCRFQTLGGFVWDTLERTGIRDAGRASAIVGVLQMAEAHPQGCIGSIGNNACTAWFTANSSVLFQPGGPLGLYNPI